MESYHPTKGCEANYKLVGRAAVSVLGIATLISRVLRVRQCLFETQGGEVGNFSGGWRYTKLK